MREYARSAQAPKAGTTPNLVRGGERRTGKPCAFTSRGLLWLLIVLTGIAWSQEEGALDPRQEDRFTIRVDVGLVVLHATVRDRRGILVSGLGEEDFQVYEDGVLQEIEFFRHEDVPVTVGLIVDHSGSMRAKRPAVVAAAMAFVRFRNPEDEMFVINFNENVTFGLPEDIPFTSEAARLQVALSRLRVGGMTALYDAVAAGLEHLNAGSQDKKVLVVISDGADNASRLELAEIMVMARKSDAIIYTIGLFEPDDPDRNPGVLRRLAEATGGEAFLPKSVQEVTPMFERIARDIRNQYTIAYMPTSVTQEGVYRTVQVQAERPGGGRLFVRTRTGYQGALKPQPPTTDAIHP